MSSGLFSSYRIRSASFRNRLWVSPMCQYAVDREDGVPTEWHLVHLGSFARGGAGLVMTEATAVTADRRVHPFPRSPRGHSARACRPQGIDLAGMGSSQGDQARR